jgi:competence protein ComGC
MKGTKRFIMWALILMIMIISSLIIVIMTQIKKWRKEDAAQLQRKPDTYYNDPNSNK